MELERAPFSETQQPTTPDRPETFLPLPKPLFDLEKRDILFAVFATAISIFTALFGIFDGFALGYLLSAVMMLILLGVYFAKGAKPHTFAVVCGALSLATDAVFLCTTNGSVRFFGVIVGLLLALACFDGLVNGPVSGNRQTFGIFRSALGTMGNAALAVRSLLSKKTGDKKTIGKVLIGLLCAIPVLLIVVPLLLASDDAFNGMMTELFNDTSTTLLRSVVGVILSVFAIAYGFSIRSGRVSKPKEKTSNGIENAYLISFLSAIAVCYLLYLFSQLAYFFSAFSGFLPDGEITYAQYARKGFFEMCAIALINLFIVFISLLIAKKKDGKVCHGIKALATFIAVFTLIIIATAISKMVLYIDVYGMTVLRLTTSSFMVFLAVVFISVIGRIHIRRINVIKTALVAAGCIVLVLGTVNVNTVCAKYNYESYRSGKLETIDVVAINDLGYEGIPYLVKLATDQDNDIAWVAKRFLAAAYLYGYFEGVEETEGFTVDDLKDRCVDREFSQFSIPRMKAYEALYEFIEQNPWFSYQCHDFFPKNG